jgi:fructokinase
MISEMGNDRVGDLIQDFMESNGVDTGSLSRYEEGQSAVALAFLNSKSDAEYQFYKDYPHQRLNVDFPSFRREDMLLFGSFYALNPGIRPRVKVLLESARKAGMAVLYDPNFRSSHLAERDELLRVIIENMTYATIVRASDEDLKNIFQVENVEDAWKVVRPHCEILIYTANAHGVSLRTTRFSLHLEVEIIQPVSTIGAGDTFNAGILYGLYRLGFHSDQIGLLEKSAWEQILNLAMEFSREVCLHYDNYLPRPFADQIKNRDIVWKKEN